MYSGVYTMVPTPCLLFTDTPYPLVKGRYPLLNIFRGLYVSGLEGSILRQNHAWNTFTAFVPLDRQMA